jgi:hypothetical protein
MIAEEHKSLCHSFNDQKTVRLLSDLFVTRRDCYCVQLKHGYSKVDEPLTDDVLREHVQGKRTVGGYQLTKDNLVKWLGFDLDPEKLSGPRETALKILHVCFEEKEEADERKRPRIWQKAVLLEASRYPDPSYHIWILFEPRILAKVAHWLGLGILELANLNPKEVEVFPKQTELTTDRPFGNFVKLPCGLHQVERKWSKFLDPSTFEPLSMEMLQHVQGISFSESDLTRIMSFEKKNHVQTSLLTPENFKCLNDKEEEEAVKFLCKYWVKGHRNELEMYFLGLCLKRGVSHESARRIIEEVTIRTNDEDKQQRLELVDYHYKNRLNVSLKGKSGIREIFGELRKSGQH